MTRVTVTGGAGQTIIETRPEIMALLLFGPYFMVLGSVAVGLGLTFWLIWFNLVHDRPGQALVAVVIAGLILLVKAFFPARLILKYLGSRSVIVIDGERLRVRVSRVLPGREQAYYTGELSNLRWQGRRGVFRVGRVLANAGTKQVVLAGAINYVDGERLIRTLRSAWPVGAARGV